MDIVGMYAGSKPDAIALIQGDRTLTWGEYRNRRNRLANALLGRGIQPGETLVQYMHNSIESTLTGMAASELRTTNTPINHRLKGPEVAYILDNSDAAAVVADQEFAPVLEELRDGCPKVRLWVLTGDSSEVPGWAVAFDELVEDGSPDPVELPEDAPDDAAAMIYTSGTTGKPKGARRKGIGDISLVSSWIQGFGLLPDDLHLVAGPLYHSAPLAFFTLATLLGNTSVIMPKFDEREALRLIEEHGVTTTFMAPVLVKRILALGADEIRSHDTSSLRVLIVAGAPCPQKVKEDVMEIFGPVFYEFYGSTELGLNTLLRPEDSIRKPGSCGQALPGVEIVLLDEEGNEVPDREPGELYVRRHSMIFNEYYKNDEATRGAEKGDLVTVGDVAYRDDDGFYFICDRKIDMVISGGVNIYPAEVEDVIHRHPEVADVAVFGVPSEEWGETVHAAVQPAGGASLSEDAVIDWTREHLADYKRPRSVSFHPDFPRDVAGKLIKRELRAPFWEGQEKQVH